MLPTPLTSHIDTSRIYEPSEDSFLLLDTLSTPSEIEFLSRRFGRNSGSGLLLPPLVLELGTGSGVVLAFVNAHAKALFGRRDVISLGVDINRFACEATKVTVSKASGYNSLNKDINAYGGVFVGVAQADLTAAIRPGVVDMLIFNPPYVPTLELPGPNFTTSSPGSSGTSERPRTFEEDSHLLSLSYAGGKAGMEVTARLLGSLPDVLCSQRGIAYVLLCKQNKPEDVIASIRMWGSHWSVHIVGQSGKTGGWEQLTIIRIERNPQLGH